MNAEPQGSVHSMRCDPFEPGQIRSFFKERDLLNKVVRLLPAAANGRAQF